MDIFVIEGNFLHSLFLFSGAFLFYHFFRVEEYVDVKVTSRVVSTIMCSAMIYGANWCLWYDNFTEEWNKVVVTGTFYTLLDSYFIVFNYAKFRSMYWEILLHHIILFYIFLNHEMSPRLIAIGLYVESSSILLNLGWFMIKAGWEKSMIFKINSGLIWITYLVFRVIGLPITFYIAEVSLWKKSVIFPLLLLNWYWFGKLTGKFIQLLRGDKLKVE